MPRLRQDVKFQTLLVRRHQLETQLIPCKPFDSISKLLLIQFWGRLITPWKLENDEDEKVDEKVPDSAKLKGVYWPGMDLFDSATPEMKRMRNQRKDGSILEQMMATSEEVEPNEISYNADGGFRACRNIFGPPSAETSPVRLLPDFPQLPVVLMVCRSGSKPQPQRSAEIANRRWQISASTLLATELHDRRRLLLP